MKYYDTYEEAKAAYPSADEILTTGKNWRFSPKLKGKFTPANWDGCEDYRHPDERTESETDGYCMGDTGWIIATPPKTRTEYVKVHQSEAVKSVLEGSRDYWCKSGESWVSLSMSSSLEEFCRAFKRVEKEIALNSSIMEWSSNYGLGYQTSGCESGEFEEIKINSTMSRSQFLDLCRAALRATGELE